MVGGGGDRDVCMCVLAMAACLNVRPSHLQTNEMSIKSTTAAHEEGRCSRAAVRADRCNRYYTCGGYTEPWNQ